MATRILVVDDALELTQLLKMTLSREGYQVEVANDSLEGLRKAYDFRPDLMLLDIMMPGMSGLEMLSRFREFSDVPVIMLTALGKSKIKIDGLNKGADDYITKPFDADELKARIRAVLRRAVLSAPEEGQILSFDGGRLTINPHARQVTVGGDPAEPHTHRIQAAALPGPQRRTGADLRPDPRPGVGAGIRRQSRRRQGLRPAPEEPRSSPIPPTPATL